MGEFAPVQSKMLTSGHCLSRQHSLKLSAVFKPLQCLRLMASRPACKLEA
jgi:hypothetical protein